MGSIPVISKCWIYIKLLNLVQIELEIPGPTRHDQLYSNNLKLAKFLKKVQLKTTVL